MSPGLTIAVTFSLYGLVPGAILLFMLNSFKRKFHLYWIFGLLFIGIGAVLIAMSEQLIHATAEWLLNNPEAVAQSQGAEAILHTKIWGYVIPAPLIGLGINLVTEFILRSDSRNQVEH